MERSRRRGMLQVVVVLGCLLPGLGRGALAQETQSPQEALLVYRDAASFQNNGAFELAAEEWERFLKRFPRDPLAGKARHYLGVCNVQLKRYPQAVDAFQAVVANHPELDAIQDAYLNLGWCQYTLAGQGGEELYAKTVETFAELLKKFPEGKYTDQALFFLAEAEYHRGRKQQAVASYAKLVAGFPESTLRIDALYALGVTHEELGQHAEAGGVYDKFLAEAADSPLVTEVQMRKAETILQAGEHAAAAEMFAAIAAVPGFDSADHALSRQAFCVSKLERFAEAGGLYARLATDYPQSVYAAEAGMSAGRCFYRAEQFPEAAKWFETVLAGGGNEAPEAAHWLCRMALKDGQPQRALELSSQVLPTAEQHAYLVHLKMDQADALYETPDRRADSLQAYLKVAADHAQHELAPQALYNAAFAALELKQYDQALTHSAAFLDAYPEHRLLPDVRYVTAESQLQGTRADKAEAAYRELLEAHPQHPETPAWRVRLGLTLYLQKKYQQTIAALEPVLDQLQRAELIAEAQYLIGASHFHQEKLQPAIAALEASLKAAPRWRQADESMLLLARAQRGAGQLQTALQTARQMIADYPDSGSLDQAHYRCGEFAYAAEDYATAAAEYDVLLSRWPASAFAPFALYGQGWCLLKTKQYEPAVAALTRLIADHAQHQLVPEAHFARAMCRRQAGQYEGAIEDVDSFLESDPDLASRSDALYERGLAQVALKRLSDAAATFQQLLEGNPQYAQADKVLYEVAWAYKEEPARQGEAIPVFARLTKEYPDSPLAAEAHFHVGESLYEQGKFDEAAAAYAAAKSRAERGDLGEKSTYKLGWAQFQQKKYDAALQEFTEQHQEYAEGSLSPDALFMIAECLYRQEKYEQALPAYLAAQEVPLSSPAISNLALLHGGQSASQVKQWEQAIELLNQLVESGTESPYVAEAHYELAFAQQNAGRQDAALKNYEEAANRSRGAVGARARFMIGEVHFGNKQYAQAIREFQRVIFGFGGETAAEDVKPWQAKSAFEAARCAEVQIRDAPAAAKPALLADAKKFYQHLVDKHPASDLVAQAQQRLQALSKQ